MKLPADFQKLGGIETSRIGFIGQRLCRREFVKKLERFFASAQNAGYLSASNLEWRPISAAALLKSRGISKEFPSRLGANKRGSSASSSKPWFFRSRSATIPAGKRPRQMSAGGEFKSRKNFFRHGDAADDRAALQNQNFFSRFGEISRGHKPVVAGADDDRVVSGHGGLDQPQFHVFENFQRREAPRRCHDTATRMGAGAAHIKILDRRAVFRPARHRDGERRAGPRSIHLEKYFLR